MPLKVTFATATFLLLSATSVFSQSYRDMARQYEQRKVDNASSNARIHQQYLNNLPNPRGSSVAAIGSAGPTKADIRAEEIRKWRDANKPSPQEQLRIDLDKAWLAIEAEKLKNKHGQQALELNQFGFTMYESYSFAINASDALENNDSAGMTKLPLAKTSLEQFKAKVGTASYDELVMLVLGFRGATYTATKAFQQLEGRFPNKSVEIHLMMLKIMPGFYLRKSYLMPEQKQTRDEQSYMEQTFIKLLKSYPIETNLVASQCEVDPYEDGIVSRWITSKEELDQKAAIFMYLLQNCKVTTPLPRPANYSYEGYAEQLKLLRGCNFFFGRYPEYIKKLKIDFWEELAKDNQLSVPDIMAYLSALNSRSMGSINHYTPKLTGWGYVLERGNYYHYKVSGVTKELALKGYPDAMNAHAVELYARGYPKVWVEVVPLLKKAAAAGSYMAVLNLYDATTWRHLEGYNDNDGQIANSTYAYFEKANADDTYAAAYFLGGGGWWEKVAERSTPKFELAAKLLTLAATQGNEEAKKTARHFLKMKI